MSSMHRFTAFAVLAAAAVFSTPLRAADGAAWDQARSTAASRQDPAIRQAIERWKVLNANANLAFDQYASFLLNYPGFPSEDKIRSQAEAALERGTAEPRAIISYFEKFPPLTNQGRARLALALASLNFPGARDEAIRAWRGGAMSEVAESTLLLRYGDQFSREDHDARMDALLWDGALTAAQRQIARVSPERRNLFSERLSIAQGSPPGAMGLPLTSDDLSDPGYVHARVQQARNARNTATAIALLAARPNLSAPVRNPVRWVGNKLWAARSAGPEQAVRIAESIDDAFAPGTDISAMAFRLRDDYTSLMWLGGTRALWTLRNPRRAAPLFYRYGAAAKTPGTRTKGFYWAGRALAEAGDRAGAARYFELAAQYPDHFYGQLSLERLDRAIPNLDVLPGDVPTREQREAFMTRPITRAVREVAREADWQTGVRFFREIAEQASTEAEHVLVADLAREIGRRDLAVILSQSAHTDGFGNFRRIGNPTIPVPPGANWTMVHAITRQESQFAMNAISHAGARGLMQLMPGTAREQAGRLGLPYDMPRLLTDATYNIQLGDGYFARMLSNYGGSYPLAVAAYNAGPGNVNRWLAANGDPRNGGIDWITWIEMIPFSETKNYVAKVLENAVVYEQLHPDKATARGKYPLSSFLGKRTPG
jgi:soluble lytic murein transglycosylase